MAAAPIPDLERLRRIPGLETGPTAELISLGSLSGRSCLPEGTVVVEPGVVPEQVLLVVSGLVEVAVPGRETVDRIGPGGLIGLTAQRRGADHEERAVVVHEAEVLSIRVDVLDRLLRLPTIDRLLHRGARPVVLAPEASERADARRAIVSDEPTS